MQSFFDNINTKVIDDELKSQLRDILEFHIPRIDRERALYGSQYHSTSINKEAICRQADDSQTDGIGASRLPFPAVSFHIDFPAVDHSEVASDSNSPARLFLTDYCKALSGAIGINSDLHILMNKKALRARSGFSSTPSVLFQKNRASIPENKYPVVVARELAFSQSQ